MNCSKLTRHECYVCHGAGKFPEPDTDHGLKRLRGGYVQCLICKGTGWVFRRPPECYIQPNPLDEWGKSMRSVGPGGKVQVELGESSTPDIETKEKPCTSE